MKIKIKRILDISRLFWKAFGAYKFQIGVLAFVGFLSGIFEGIGVNALIPLFSLATGGESQGADFISHYIEKAFVFAHVDFSVKYLLVFILILFLLKAVMLFVGTYVEVKIASDYEKKTRMFLFQKTVDSSWSHLLRQKMGHLEKMLSFEIDKVTGLLQIMSSVVLVLTTLAVYLLVAINISPLITVVAVAFGVATLVAFSPLAIRIKRIMNDWKQTIRSVAHFVNESMSGIKTLKSMSAGKQVIDIGNNYFTSLRDLRVKSALVSSIPTLLMQPVSLIFILALFSISYKTFNFNLPAFIVLVYLIQRIFTYVQSIQGAINKASSSIPYLEGVLDYQYETVAEKEEDTGVAPFSFMDSMYVKNLSFSYARNKNAVLSGLTFKIQKGEFVGLIGPSGAGKTTIVDIMLRLFRETGGELLIDGVSVDNISLRSLRKNIGYVSQDIYLTNDTIARNIKFYNSSITDEEMKHAAQMAHIRDVIESFPKGFETVIGERGVMLSAGQRQRIVIARVLARKPQLLILDEATSALDNESEIAIQKAIENLKGKTTVLAIAHRLGTVLNCDTLFVLQNGRITEQGQPKELLKNKDSYFFKMYNIRK